MPDGCGLEMKNTAVTGDLMTEQEINDLATDVDRAREALFIAIDALEHYEEHAGAFGTDAGYIARAALSRIQAILK